MSPTQARCDDVEQGASPSERLVPAAAVNTVKATSGPTTPPPAVSTTSQQQQKHESAQDGPRLFGVPMKWVSLMALTLQTSGQVFLIKWAKAGQDSSTPYLTSTVVFFTELVKTVASLALVFAESGSRAAAYKSLHDNFASAPLELLKAAVPCLIYAVQNNLMFYSLEKLSGPVQQVLYQTKILTTAGLGVLMLGKKLSATQWTALMMLVMGIVLVQWPKSEGAGLANSTVAGVAGVGSSTVLGVLSVEQLKGSLAVFCACCTSGFAGVYIQKMLQQTTASIWMRNVQFGLFGSAMSLLMALAKDGQAIAEAGLLQGYSSRVLLVVLMNAFGGLLCAAMLKYAGATLGCFSTALSIILTCVLSATLLQDFVPDSLFVLGSLLAIGATLLYGLGLPEFFIAAAEKLASLPSAHRPCDKL